VERPFARVVMSGAGWGDELLPVAGSGELEPPKDFPRSGSACYGCPGALSVGCCQHTTETWRYGSQRRLEVEGGEPHAGLVSRARGFIFRRKGGS
jgi:hypothetical protein